MKNNNVDFKSLIIGFLMATCMMMALAANSKPMSETIYQKHSGSISLDLHHSGIPIQIPR